MSWVVVLLGDDCAQDPGATCPMQAIGPFEHIDRAREAAEKLPPGMKPHIIGLRPPAGSTP